MRLSKVDLHMKLQLERAYKLSPKKIKEDDKLYESKNKFKKTLDSISQKYGDRDCIITYMDEDIQIVNDRINFVQPYLSDRYEIITKVLRHLFLQGE
jgi:hypothetical protein